MITHKPYPSDVSDAEWQFVVPYLCLLPEDAGQRVYNLRDVLPRFAMAGPIRLPVRYLPKDFPPWEMVYQQTRRWLAAGCFEAIVHDLRAVAVRRRPRPRADRRRPRQPHDAVHPRERRHGPATTDTSGSKGSKVHAAVDTLGHLLALHVTPADVQDRHRVALLAEAVQEVTGDSVELAYVDQGYTGPDAELSPRPTRGSSWRS